MAEPATKRQRRSIWKTGYGTQCCFADCRNYAGVDRELLFTGFPKDLDRARQWLINSRRQEFDDLLKVKSIEELWPLIKSKKICSAHFERTFFNFKNPSKVKDGLNLHQCLPTILSETVKSQPQRISSKRRKLTRACPPPPTATVTEAPPETVTTETMTALVTHDHGYMATPQGKENQKAQVVIKKLKNEVRNLKRGSKRAEKKRDVTVQDALDTLRTCLPPEAHRFLEMQVRAVAKKPQGRRWTQTNKQVAVTLYHSSPATYRLLKQMFVMPSVTTLKQMERKLDIRPGFHQSVLKALQVKAGTLTSAEKDVVLLVDELSIKETLSYDIGTDTVEGFEDFGDSRRSQYIANHACVFMVRGMQAAWKQPIGYFLTSGTMEHSVLTAKVLEAITSLQSAGLKVRVLVCDQGSNNQAMFTSLGINVKTPYFFVDGQKVIGLSDPPHLIKNIRNNLKKSGFKVGKENVSWDHITEAYNVDCQSGRFRMLHKLSDKHIEIPPFKTMSVKLATQVISHTMFSTIGTLVHHGYMDKEALVTANFVKQFDTLFDICNSKTFDSKLYRTPIPLTGNVDACEQMKELSSLATWLSTVKCSKSTQLPCLKGWRTTISGTQELCHDLANEDGWNFLMTRRLNQDALENFFSIIRGKNGFMDNPDPRQFRAAYRACVMDRLHNLSDGSNCEEDGDKLLVQVQDYEAVDEARDDSVDDVELMGAEVEVVSEEAVEQEDQIADENGFQPVENLAVLVGISRLEAELSDFNPPGHTAQTSTVTSAANANCSTAQVSGIPAQVSGIPAQVSGIPAQVSGIPAQVSDIPAQVSGIPAQVSGILAQVSGIPAQVSGIPAQVSGIPAQVSGIPAQVSGILAQVSGILAQVSGIPAQVSGIPAQVSGIPAQVSGIPAQVSDSIPTSSLEDLFACGNTSVVSDQILSVLSVAGGIAGNTGSSLSELETNVLVYVCGYLSRKNQIRCFCKACLDKQVVCQSKVKGDEFTFIKKKQYDTLSEGQGLFAPTPEMISFVKSMESILDVHLAVHMHGVDVVKSLHKKMMNLDQTISCSKCNAASVPYMSKLYIRVRLFSILKRHNQAASMPSKGKKRNRKMLKLLHA